jgi:hypothetical protein
MDELFFIKGGFPIYHVSANSPDNILEILVMNRLRKFISQGHQELRFLHPVIPKFA